MTNNERSLFKTALNTHGIYAQIDMFIEECSEAIVALQHYKRGRVTLKEVQEELADVGIMKDQLSIFFGEQETNLARDSKVERLAERLNYDKFQL